MDVENAVYPTRSRIEALMADSSDAAVVMLNLLRFRNHAAYSDGRSTGLTGREAYGLYASAMRKVVEAHDGKFLFAGNIDSMVIGEVDDLWDACALVEYPSAAAFAAIAVSPEVAEIGAHRAAGLDGQLLIRVTQQPF
ncbi:MAG: DUF1330 domain-containing protein [Mycobacterium sp.]|nr:DUF1330 domain-containing protein [Mycobacterium sp.]